MCVCWGGGVEKYDWIYPFPKIDTNAYHTVLQKLFLIATCNTKYNQKMAVVSNDRNQSQACNAITIYGYFSLVL